MAIEKLQKLKLYAVQPEGLRKAVEDLLVDYEKTADKEFFNETARDNIEKLFSMVKRLAPDAIIGETPKKEVSKKSNGKKPKTVKDELDELNADIKACRLKIRKYNEEKRKNEPKKPKPTRHLKIKKHFISIANLIPPAHKDNLEVQKEAEKVLLRAYRGIMNAYRINTVKAEAGERAIKEKYDKMEEKITK